MTLKDLLQLQKLCIEQDISKGAYLTDDVFYCTGSQRQNEGPAKALISPTTAELLRENFPNDQAKLQLADVFDAISEGLNTSEQLYYVIDSRPNFQRFLQ